MEGDLNSLSIAEKEELKEAIINEIMRLAAVGVPAHDVTWTAGNFTVTLAVGSIIATIEFPKLRALDIHALEAEISANAMTVTIAGGTKQFTSTDAAVAAASPSPPKAESASPAVAIAAVSAVLVLGAALGAVLWRSKKRAAQTKVAPQTDFELFDVSGARQEVESGPAGQPKDPFATTVDLVGAIHNENNREEHAV